MKIPATSSDEVTQVKLNLYKRASLLALITIFYNLIEGFVSVFFGATDETLSLLGFGFDSFVEVLSGIGIWYMVRRIRHNLDAHPDSFEKKSTPNHRHCILSFGRRIVRYCRYQYIRGASA